MRKYWLLIIITAIFEVVWVVGLKHAVTGIEWGLHTPYGQVSVLLVVH